MKTWRFIGMALLAVILCVNFTACSDDDEQNGNGGTAGNEMKVSTFTWDDGSWYELSYDKQGRISNLEEYDETGELVSYVVIDYNENNIRMTVTFPSSGRVETSICTLNSEKLIEKTVLTYNEDIYDSETVQYTYDDNGQLISIYNTDSGEENHLTWENGNLVKDEYKGYEEEAETVYHYTSIPSSKGYFVFFDDMMIDIFSNYDLNILANEGCFGKVPQNLLSGGTFRSSTWELTYELGENGYVSKISGIEENEDYWATLTWK